MVDLGDGYLPIPLAGFRVELRDETGTAAPAAVATDASGLYRFPRQRPGTYKLHWSAPGWSPGSKQVEVVSQDRFVGPIVVRPKQSDQVATLLGRVKLDDSSSPSFKDEFFGIEQSVDIRVTTTDGKGLEGGRAVANAEGEFIIAGMPRQGLKVYARLVRRSRNALNSEVTSASGEELSQIVDARRINEYINAVPTRDGPVELEGFFFSGRPPKLEAVTASIDGTRLSEIRPGRTALCTVTVAEEDRNRNLKYTWKLVNSNKEWTDPDFRWTVADYEGNQTAYVLVTDGCGGYATGSVTLSVTSHSTSDPAKARP
jgi:hypothetical protein